MSRQTCKVLLNIKYMSCIIPWLSILTVDYLFFPGNIDQAQYCERIKGIIELLGSKLSLDELSKIWRIQVSNKVCSIMKLLYF